MLSESIEEAFTYENTFTELRNKVKDYGDDTVFEYIAKVIITDQPKNEHELENLIKVWLHDESKIRVDEVLIATRELYTNMIFQGFIPAERVKMSEGRKKFEEHSAKQRSMVPELVIHHDRSESHKVDINIENVTISIGGKTLLEDANLKINHGRRYVLIGRNGLGKTTLLNHIASKDIDGIPKYLQILHVEQETVANEVPLLEEVLSVDVYRTKLLADLDETSNLLDELEFGSRKGEEGGEELIVELTEKYTDINEKLQTINADDSETQAIKILQGLGFSNQDLNKKTREFSGGWRMRISLAKALFAKPDILLLDEPTNHLDMHAVMWLEDYLVEWPYTIVIVSHARSFINNVATDIINLCQLKFVYYKGNYDDYVKAKKERNTNLEKVRERQNKEKEHLQHFIDRFRANAKRAALVQSKIKMVNKMEIEDEIPDDPEVLFMFPEVEELAAPILRLKKVSLGYGNNKVIIDKCDFNVDMESRIAIVGPNGAGKSTLMKCLYNQLKELSGDVYRHPKLKIAMFTQHHVDQLDLDHTPIETIASLKKESVEPEKIRFYLAGFGIVGNLSTRPNYMLSGGQKTRVALACLVYNNPHIIIMDEPTNHMDIDSVNALAVALKAYNGGLVIVSHDEYFVESVCNTIYIVGKKKCVMYNGTFDEYRKQVRKEIK
jgi:ATP-binding cassette subfamily F protein 3